MAGKCHGSSINVIEYIKSASARFAVESYQTKCRTLNWATTVRLFPPLPVLYDLLGFDLHGESLPNLFPSIMYQRSTGLLRLKSFSIHRARQTRRLSCHRRSNFKEQYPITPSTPRHQHTTSVVQQYNTERMDSELGRSNNQRTDN